MNSFETRRPIRAALAALGLLIAAAAPAQTVDNRPEVKQAVLDNVSEIVLHKAYVPGVDFSAWPKMLADVKPKIDAAKNDDEFVRAVNEALSKFGTSHLTLLSPRKDESFMTNQMVGVGISVQRQDDGSLIVVRTYADAPAERGGIVPGDTITEVDGKKTDGTAAGIVGPEGTDVTLTIKHANGIVEHFILTRRSYSLVRPEELTWVTPDTAKLAIYSFDYSYDADHVNELMKQAMRAKNLILDLRDNGGGAVVFMDHLLGMLMPADKPIGIFVDRRQIAGFTKEGGNPTDMVGLAKWTKVKEMPHPNQDVAAVFSGNIVVLINAFSGSASEIAAAALRDQVHATVIGAKSAGAVRVSVVAHIADGFGVQYPLSDFITPTGVRLEGNGVVPDIVLKEPRIRLPGDKDEFVDKALQVFAMAKKIGG